MSRRDSDPNWQALLTEQVAAREALDVANSTITVLTATAGIPIEYLERECRAESRARAKLVDVRRRMDHFELGGER